MSSPSSPYCEEEESGTVSSTANEDEDFRAFPPTTHNTPSHPVVLSNFITPIKMKRVDLRPDETPTPNIKRINKMLGFETPTSTPTPAGTAPKPKRKILVSEYKLLKLSRVIKGQAAYGEALKKELARVVRKAKKDLAEVLEQAENDVSSAEQMQIDTWNDFLMARIRHEEAIETLQAEHAEEVEALTQEKDSMEEKSASRLKKVKKMLRRYCGGDVEALKNSNALLRTELQKLREPFLFDEKLRGWRLVSTRYKSRWQREAGVSAILRAEVAKLRMSLAKRERELLRCQIGMAHKGARKEGRRRYVLSGKKREGMGEGDEVKEEDDEVMFESIEVDEEKSKVKKEGGGKVGEENNKAKKEDNEVKVECREVKVEGGTRVKEEEMDDGY